MTKPDLSKLVKKPAFSQPTAVAPGLSGAPPLPPGRPMTLKKVSPGEKAVLTKYGWQEGDPVPANLADIIAEVEADLGNLTPPVDLKTPTLKLPKEVNIGDLPESEREKYLQVMSSLTEAKTQKLAQDELNSLYVESSHDAVAINNAIRTAAGQGIQLELDDDTDSRTEATAVATDVHSDKGHSKYCLHCGWDQDVTTVAEVTEDDKVSFLQALLGLKPFVKMYTIFGGRMTVTIRSLVPDEIDLCFKQIYIDRQSKTTINPAEEAENLARYKACMQIAGVIGPALSYTGQDISKLDERKDGNTRVYSAWLRFKEKLNAAETHHRTLLGLCMRFNQLVQRLEDNIDNSDFWPTIG